MHRSFHFARLQQAFSPAPFIPNAEAQQITEPAARDALSSYCRLDVSVPAFPQPVATAVIPPKNNDPNAPPLVALHGFDSSSLVRCKDIPL